MKIPRILSQTRIAASAGWTPLNSSLFRNDGDHVLFLTHINITIDGTEQNPRLIFQPSSGPGWSKIPVLPSMYYGAYNGTSAAPWVLRHPFPLAPNDSLQGAIFHSNSPADGTIGFSMSIFGYKDTDVIEAPKEYWSPRILYTERLNLDTSSVSTFTFNTEDLRSWDDYPMTVTDFLFHPIDNLASPDDALRGDEDALRLRVSLGNQQWTSKGRLAQGSIIQPTFHRIQVPFVQLRPGAAFNVEMTAAANSTALNAHFAVIGYVKVKRC